MANDWRDAQIQANRLAEQRRQAQIAQTNAQRAMERQQVTQQQAIRTKQRNEFVQEAQRPIPGLWQNVSRPRQKSSQGDTFSYDGNSGTRTAADFPLGKLWKVAAGIIAVFAGINAMGWVARSYQTAWWVPLTALVLVTWGSFRVLYNPLVIRLVTAAAKVAMIAFASIVLIEVVVHLSQR